MENEKIKTINMELTLITDYFDMRKHLIVPNISWGMGLHECDLLVMTKSGYLTEVEIKISAGDLKADFKKGHGHINNKIKYFYYAVPESLQALALELIPERAGLLVVIKNTNRRIRKPYYCRCVKNPICNNEAKPLTEKEKFQMARLGTMRVWGLKKKIEKLTNEKIKEEVVKDETVDVQQLTVFEQNGLR